MAILIRLTIYLLIVAGVVPALAAPLSQSEIDWLLKQRRGGDSQLERDFYWNATVQRWASNRYADNSHYNSCGYAGIAYHSPTCYKTVTVPVFRADGHVNHRFQLMVRIEYGSGDALQRLMCIYPELYMTEIRCIDWDEDNTILIPEPILSERGSVLDYKFHPDPQYNPPKD